MSAMQQDPVDIKLTNNQELLDKYQCGCSIVRGKGVVMSIVFVHFFPFIGISLIIILVIIYEVSQSVTVDRKEGREMMIYMSEPKLELWQGLIVHSVLPFSSSYWVNPRVQLLLQMCIDSNNNCYKKHWSFHKRMIRL